MSFGFIRVMHTKLREKVFQDSNTVTGNGWNKLQVYQRSMKFEHFGVVAEYFCSRIGLLVAWLFQSVGRLRLQLCCTVILSVSFCVSSSVVFVFVSSHGSVIQCTGRLRLVLRCTVILSISFCVSSPTVFVFVSSHGSVVQYIGRLRLLYCDSLTVSVSFPVVFVFISSHVSVIQHIGNGRQYT